MKRILELNHLEARQYLLKAESYFNFDLPQYFVFQKLIEEVSIAIVGRPIEDFYLNPPDYSKPKPEAKHPFPSDFDDINYKLLNNKDGKFSWRPFQLVHPALYVSLVHNITEKVNWNLIIARFGQFASNPKIKCYSIPLQSDGKQSDKSTNVSQWWHNIEQHSIQLSLEYDYVLHTDITDCYGSIYTHSIPWAIHTKTVAKKNRKKNGNIGNIIDKHLQDMAFGQTNGIPQGSVLMDFIAEMVLGYADTNLSTKIKQSKIKDYYILRYRDDYRIFSNNPQDAELITKILTEILIELGMRLNAQKTFVSNNVIRDSIKHDKIFWMAEKNEEKSIPEHLLLIHNLSDKFPNSGSLSKALGQFYERIEGKTKLYNIEVLISILVDIMYKNPRTYPISSAILSKLLSLLNDPNKRDRILKSILTKFEKIPNIGHIKIWLQRLTIKLDRLKVYDEDLCHKVNDLSFQIWNSDWLNDNLKTLISTIPIIDEQIIQGIDVVINQTEVQLFKPEYVDYVK
jgi:hypothetical protein